LVKKKKYQLWSIAFDKYINTCHGFYPSFPLCFSLHHSTFLLSMIDVYLCVDNSQLYSTYPHPFNNWQYVAAVTQPQHDPYTAFYNEDLSKPIFDSYQETKNPQMLDAGALEYPSPSPSLSGSPMMPMCSVDSAFATSIAPSNLIWSPAPTVAYNDLSPMLASAQSPQSQPQQNHQPQPPQHQSIHRCTPSTSLFSTFSVAPLNNSLAATTKSQQKSVKKQPAKPRKSLATTSAKKIVKHSSKPAQSYQCDYPGCNKTFTRPYNLKSHKRTHTAEKPYHCEHTGCNRRFARQHDRNRHNKLHSNIKPFSCEYCHKAFARQDALSRHQRVDGAPCSVVALENRKVNRLRK
jgi:hypothetical protein